MVKLESVRPENIWFSENSPPASVFWFEDEMGKYFQDKSHCVIIAKLGGLKNKKDLTIILLYDFLSKREVLK